MIIGILLLILGTVYLLKSLNIIIVPITFGEIIIPLILILAGFYLISASMKFRRIKEYKKRLFKEKNGRR